MPLPILASPRKLAPFSPASRNISTNNLRETPSDTLHFFPRLTPAPPITSNLLQIFIDKYCTHVVICSVIVKRHFKSSGAERRTSSILRTHFQVPYPVSPVFATLAKTPGVWGILPNLENLPRSRRRKLTFHSSPFFSHSCALFGTTRNSTRFFSSDCALFTAKHPGWGEVTGRVCRSYRGLSTANSEIVNPSAAPKNTSDGKCACVVTREKLIAPAAPYATHGTQRCCR